MRRKLAWLLFTVGCAVLMGWSPAAAQESPINGVIGSAEVPLLARYHPDFAAVCAIEPNEAVLAIAQTDDLYLIYAGGDYCEGPVWLSVDAAITWADEAALATLPETERPTATPLTDLEDYEALCQAAPTAVSEGIDPASVQSIFWPGGFSWFVPRFLATEDNPPDAIICIASTPQSVGVCSNLNTRVERFQDQTSVHLLAYPTGSLIAAQRFTGNFPEDCPNAADTEYSINGAPVAREVWGAWLLDRLGAGGGDQGLRSRTLVPRLNARALDNTQADILNILEQGTPINFIARNEAGTWGVALLPDMSRAWLFIDFLTVAAQTDFDALPVVSGPATAIAVPLP